MTESDLRAACRQIEARIGEVLALERTGAWPATRHKLDESPARALMAALAAGRPLLVRGEPGVGKSQLARAAANLLERPFVPVVIQPDSEYQELLWAMDHTKRLADAQLAAHTGDTARVQELANYIAPGALWWAFNWQSAGTQAGLCRHNFNPPEDIDPELALARGCVLLIDEIDKADIALANGLLEVLGNREFNVPPLGIAVRAEVHPPPLVVLTSNDTRQLPAALLRRCVVLEMTLPEDPKAHFVERGATHFPEMDPDLLERAAEQILGDREACPDNARTGLAEYLDLLRALDEVAKGETAEQHLWLDRLGVYFLKSRAVPS